MNFYKKINQFTLEKFPTIWNTHFIWMVAICIFSHVLYFGLGYAILDIEMLKEYGIKYVFAKGAYFSIYIIIGLLYLIYFGFRYFAHNPFKHFYPISTTYFWKILAQLFIIFLLYGSVFISFENGMRLKANKIAPLEIVEKEANQIALATPFFYNEKQDYFIKNRSFPKPFPCDDVENFTIGYDSINRIDIKHNIDFKKPYVTLNGNQFQFGHISQISIYSCNTKEQLDTIYDLSNIYGLRLYSLYNYSGTNFYRNKKHVGEQSSAESYQDIQLEKIHSWQKNNDSIAIANVIKDVKNICIKYKISEQLNPMKMAIAGLKQDLSIQPLIRTGFKDYKEYGAGQMDDSDNQSNVISSVEQEYDKGSSQIAFNYFVDIPKFNALQQNAHSLEEEMGNHQLFSSALWVLIIGALAFAFLFVMIKYIKLQDLLIGIFTTGVLAAIFALYIASTNRFNYSNSEIIIFRKIIFYAAIVIGIGLYGIYSNAIKKQLVTKWFVAFGIAIITIFPSLLFYIRQKLFTEVLDKCAITTNKLYVFDLAAWQFFLLALVSISIIFITLRKLYSKME